MPLNRLLLIPAIAIAAAAFSVWGAARTGAFDNPPTWLLLPMPLACLAWRFFGPRPFRTGDDRDRPES